MNFLCLFATNIEKKQASSNNTKQKKSGKHLDAQRQHGKAIFGGGYLVSDRVAEKEERARTTVFLLREREREIVERLNGNVLADR